jgi:hypothetical protein
MPRRRLRVHASVAGVLALAALGACSGADDPGVAPAADDGSPPAIDGAPAPDVAPPAQDAGSDGDATIPDAADAAQEAPSDAPYDTRDARDARAICHNDAGVAPAILECTGLYDDFEAKTIAQGVRQFDPGLHLWSDGATKTRWIQLPAGTQIVTDAPVTNPPQAGGMDEWTFPPGTKVWKEFQLQSKRIETRYFEKNVDGSWIRTTYRWSADGQSSATQLTTGEQNVGGTGYEVPSVDQCETCHLGRFDNLLGFEAVALSSPNATGLDMAALVAEGLLTAAPAAPIVVPGASQVEKDALGWLHINCGVACHNRNPSANATAADLPKMRLEVSRLASAQTTDAWITNVGVASMFQPMGQSGYLRIRPGSSATSTIAYRDGTRDIPFPGNKQQMPPIATHAVDTVDVANVRAWIDGL